jgi:hypothetical protein
MSENFMPVKNKKVHSIQMYEGSWYRVKGYNYTECCDCALVHKEQFRIVDGHLEWSGIRDDKLTDERRKELGIKVVRKKVKSDKRKGK